MRRPTIAVAAITGLLLLVPLVAMQFTREVAWGPGDFVVAALLLFGAGMAMVGGVRRVRTTGARIAVVAVVAAGLALVWAELAVGLFT